MASLPRIVTVDPNNNIPQQIRAAFDLMDRLVVQIDVPGASEALEELKRGGCDLVVAAWEPGDDMQGWELAAKIKKLGPEIRVVVMGDYGDMDMDDDMLAQSPFVYLKRPFDIPQLIRVLQAALDGGDIFDAVRPQIGAASEAVDMGPVPNINIVRAEEIIAGLLRDLNAMAILLATREGGIVIEQGTVGLMNRDGMTYNLIPAIVANINMREIIGGNVRLLQFFDGDEYDIFVLSAGMHHFLCIIFDGQRGSRELGPVNTYGRRAAEDLIGIIGAEAWLIRRVVAQENEEQIRRKSQPRPAEQEKIETTELERAKLSDTRDLSEHIEKLQQTSGPKLNAIDDAAFDPDALFSEDFDENEVDDLFSMEALEELAKNDDAPSGTIDRDKARELGLLE